MNADAAKHMTDVLHTMQKLDALGKPAAAEDNPSPAAASEGELTAQDYLAVLKSRS